MPVFSSGLFLQQFFEICAVMAILVARRAAKIAKTAKMPRNNDKKSRLMARNMHKNGLKNVSMLGVGQRAHHEPVEQNGATSSEMARNALKHNRRQGSFLRFFLACWESLRSKSATKSLSLRSQKLMAKFGLELEPMVRHLFKSQYFHGCCDG